MRIYDPRLGRFLSVDPLTKSYPHYAPYQFAGNMPIMAIDLDGKEIYGFMALKQDVTFGRPALILSSSSVWNNVLKNTFAAVGKGDNLGQTSNGRFVGVAELNFNAYDDSHEMVGGKVSAFVIQNNVKVPLDKAVGVQQGDKFVIEVSLNSGMMANPKREFQKDAAAVVTITHETATHAIDQALLIEQFQKGEIDATTLLATYKNRINDQKEESKSTNTTFGGTPMSLFVKDHKRIRDGTNPNYEGILNDVQKVLNVEPYNTTGIQRQDGSIENEGAPLESTNSGGQEIRRINTTKGKVLGGARALERTNYSVPNGN
jgi:hypothetical protein